MSDESITFRPDDAIHLSRLIPARPALLNGRRWQNRSTSIATILWKVRMKIYWLNLSTYEFLMENSIYFFFVSTDLIRVQCSWWITEATCLYMSDQIRIQALSRMYSVSFSISNCQQFWLIRSRDSLKHFPASFFIVTGLNSVNEIPDLCYNLPKLETPSSEALHEFIDSVNEEKPFNPTIQIIRWVVDTYYYKKIFTHQELSQFSQRLESCT